MVDPHVEEETGFTEEEHELFEMLKRKQRIAGDGGKKAMTDETSTYDPKGNFATFAHSATGTHSATGIAHALASIPPTRSLNWIIDSGASRHVTGASSEFTSYTHLTPPESIQTADGTAQPVVGKGIVKCTDLVTLSNVLHAPSFPVNLLSISAIILQLNCVVSFDIPKVIFTEKETGRRLGTGTWHRGLWYMDRGGLDSALTSVVEGARVGGSGMTVEEVFLRHHRRMGHLSFSVLSLLYLSFFIV